MIELRNVLYNASEMECGICWESNPGEWVQTGCGHYFDSTCLSTYFATQTQNFLCPMDRMVIVLTREQLDEIWQLRLVRIDKILSEIHPSTHQLSEQQYHLREQEMYDRYEQALKEGSQVVVEHIRTSAWGCHPNIVEELLIRTVSLVIFTPPVGQYMWVMEMLGQSGDALYNAVGEAFMNRYGDDNYTAETVREFGKLHKIAATWGLLVAIKSDDEDLFEELRQKSHIATTVLCQLLPHFEAKQQWIERFFLGGFYTAKLRMTLIYSLKNPSTLLSDWVHQKLLGYPDKEFFFEKLLADCIVAKKPDFFRQCTEIAVGFLGGEGVKKILKKLQESLS